jgi:hypothetical protein
MDDHFPCLDASKYCMALRCAQAHGAGPLAVDGYQQAVELCGHIASGWLFRYRVVCNLNIPAQEQEFFAGAAGCLVTDDGQVEDLSGPVFMDMVLSLA